MTEDLWWIDTDPWPGPYELPPISSNELKKAAQQIGLSFEAIVKQFQTVYKQFETIQLLVEKTDEKKKGMGRVQNHGPRPPTTFDRRGRRRY